MPSAFLEPVAAGQTRFRMHGLAPDARGIVVGREALLVFESLDRLVAFLGAYSREASLDELLPHTSIERGRRRGGGLALMLRCAAGDAYHVDRLARLGAATRARVFVGGGHVFVKTRERKAPFGYDLAQSVDALGGRAADEVLAVDPSHIEALTPEGTIDPVDLILRLGLRPEPLPAGGVGADNNMCGLRELALVLVAPGISDRVLAYLWHRRVPMAGVRLALGEDDEPSLLLRLRQPDARSLDVIRAIPGVEVMVPVSPRAAVQLGWRHPIHLAAADSCLPGDEMCLFRGRAQRVERLEGAPRFVDGRYLVRSSLGEGLREIESVAGFEPKSLQVELRVRPSERLREVKAVLVPWEQLDLLKKLVYAIPPSALASASVAPLMEGLLVLASRPGVPARATGVDLGAVIPLGRRYVEAGAGVLVADGYELWPRVRPKLARELMGLGAEDVAVFLHGDERPVRIDGAKLRPLDAAAVASFVPSDATTTDLEVPALGPGEVQNKGLGRFALWGFRRRAH